jgi:acyl-CoA synthetase (NDP forming)
LRARVVSSFKNAGIQVSKTLSKKAGLSVSVSSEGVIDLKVGNRGSLVIEDLPSFTQALMLLFLAARSEDMVDEPDVEPERSDIDLIVRPPARLLSETASKRIVKAFGVDAPREQLCQSPSEAVRFAGTLGTPVTLKLFRELQPFAGQFSRFYPSLLSWAHPSPLGYWYLNRWGRGLVSG